MPVFEQAALALASEASHVLCARFDKTQNDFPIRGIKILHYPTVLLFPTYASLRVSFVPTPSVV